MKLNLVLFTIFLVFKLIGLINWSWIWVLSPLWISILIAIVYFFLIKNFYNF